MMMHNSIKQIVAGAAAHDASSKEEKYKHPKFESGTKADNWDYFVHCWVAISHLKKPIAKNLVPASFISLLK